MERTNKTAGDFANTSGGLANQLRIMKAEVTDTQAEIGQALLPVLASLLPVVRNLVTQFGSKLKDAVASVNWREVITSVVNLLTFFVQNIEIITKLAATLWVLNTAYNAIKVAQGLYNAVAVITNILLNGTEIQAKKTTISLGILRSALLFSGIGIGILALGFVAEGISKAGEGARVTTPTITSFGTAVLQSGKDADWAAGKYGAAKSAIEGLSKASADYRPPTISAGASAAELRRMTEQAYGRGSLDMSAFGPITPSPTSAGGSTSGSSGGGLTSLINAANQNAKVAKKTITLQNC
jgi:hypothetical protein